jgi:Na+-transporting NADH:ubiquinone oxidoreductase subunit C
VSELNRGPSNTRVLTFMLILSFSCALILASLATALKEPQEKAALLNRSKEMLISAKIFSHEGYFLLKNANGKYEPARYDFDQKKLVLGTSDDMANADSIFAVYESRVKPFLVDTKGNRTTFEKQKIDFTDYIDENVKTGYYKLPLKLIYEVSPNGVTASKGMSPEGYILPVNGFGLWGAIYGYLAIEADGNTVKGISWYEHIETPGLGANISAPSWQRHFPGKKIFQEGVGDFSTAPLGISVVRGKVSETLINNPKANSAVDGMAGATLTGNGVTKAYKESLSRYRPFFISLHKAYENKK